MIKVFVKSIEISTNGGTRNAKFWTELAELSKLSDKKLYRQAQRYPDLPLSSKVKGVVSLYDVSDDWIPIYDKSDLPGFYMAIGSSGNQYKNAPIAGVMMTKLIESCESGQNHDDDPVQLDLKYINRKIDIGFYSRNRIINSESSMSVLG